MEDDWTVYPEPAYRCRALSILTVAALVVVLSATTAGCALWGADEMGSAQLTVVNLGEEIHGWRIRAEAYSDELDGSPTFYFSDSELVEGQVMTSEETSLGARSYVLIFELAEPSTGEVRRCGADFVVADGDSLELTLDARSFGSSRESTELPACSLDIEGGSTPSQE